MRSSVRGTSSTLAGRGGRENGPEADACCDSMCGDASVGTPSQRTGALSGCGAGEIAGRDLELFGISAFVIAEDLFNHDVIED